MHMFEHGSSAAGDTVACSVEHAHLHLVPADVQVWSSLARQFEWQELSNWEELPEAVQGHEYLMYRPPGGDFYVSIQEDGTVPSQLMRRVIANQLGDSDWNWRVTPHTDLVERIFRELRMPLSHALSPNNASLNGRVRVPG